MVSNPVNARFPGVIVSTKTTCYNPSAMHQERYLTTSDLVARYGYHVGSIRRMIRQRRLPAVRIGKSYFFPAEAIAAFEASHSVTVGDTNT